MIDEYNLYQNKNCNKTKRKVFPQLSLRSALLISLYTNLAIRSQNCGC